jgi:phosphoenolpyruvate-protein kinase (PTS system EI component)
MANDPELEPALRTTILQEQVPLRQAIDRVFDRLETALSEKDAYLSERRFDLIDFRRLMSEILEDAVVPPVPGLPEGAVIVMDQLLSTTLAPLDFTKIVAVLAQEGGFHSHAAILLESLKIPVFFRKDLFRIIRSGDTLGIDLNRKKLFVNDIPEISLSVPGFSRSRKGARRFSEKVELYPCLNVPEEAMTLDPDSVGGIGLVRTETLMLAKHRFPDEEEQTAEFLPLIRHMENKPVFFRLMDIEPDKLPAHEFPKVFGAAFLIAHPVIPYGQFRVFLKMSQEHSVGIIFPMIRHPREVEILTRMFDEIRRDFPVSPFPVQIGAMVETLDFARHLGTLENVDFLTIGSNDLVCELHHCDRLDGGFSPKWFRESPFLETVKIVLDQTKLPVFVCGEAANDPRSVELLSEVGVRCFCPAVHHLGIFDTGVKK